MDPAAVLRLPDVATASGGQAAPELPVEWGRGYRCRDERHMHGRCEDKGKGSVARARMPSINTISLALRCVLGRLKLGAKCVT